MTDTSGQNSNDHGNPHQPLVQEALKLLGINNFLFGIHDTAFPGIPEEDLGCGTPYSLGAERFFSFIRDLGFNGIQLGPQGITTPVNPSPYDGTQFSKNRQLLAPLPLTELNWKLLDQDHLTDLVSQRPTDSSRVHRTFAERAMQQITAEICRRYRRNRATNSPSHFTALQQAFATYRLRNADWLERDALFEVLQQSYGGKSWKRWGGTAVAQLDRQLFSPSPDNQDLSRKRISALLQHNSVTIEDYCFIQFLLAEQHQGLRTHCRRLRLKLFADCQIGMSERDAWFAQSFLLREYLLGAPPSRTNPEGQPWSYPVLDPHQYFRADCQGGREPGPALRFFRQRIDKLFSEFDGLRIDHPHGLISPWVYRADQEDSLCAVQNGARLFAAPDLADHPDLAGYAIARPDQLNRQRDRFADDWVTGLDPDQVRRYAFLFEEIMTAAQNKGCGAGDIACEILSTQPYPLKRVMESFGQGRFRVTQKADLDNRHDVYRSENAHPEDWLMLGNHDTAPIWKMAAEWLETGASRKQATYLAERLKIPERERSDWVNHLSNDVGALVQAKFADLFVGPARNVMVYFTDLFGLEEPFNRPGTTDESNWSLRVSPDYKNLYREKLPRDLILNIPRALALALRTKGEDFISHHRQLITGLESSKGP